MSRDLSSKVTSRETIKHLKEEITFYSTRDLTPNQVYNLITKTKEYREINQDVILLTIEGILGEEYVSKIDFIGKNESSQPILNPDNVTYEPEPHEPGSYERLNVLDIRPVQETMQKLKKKKISKGKKVGCIISWASVGGYIGYQEYQKEQRQQRRIAEERIDRELRERKENERITKDIYLGPAVCWKCKGKMEDTCDICHGKKEVIVGEYIEAGIKQMQCPYCKGVGYQGRMGQCPKCNGRGEIYLAKDAINNRHSIPCPICKDKITQQSTGIRKCFICSGTGEDGDQMATVICNGFGETKDTLKKWIKK